MALPRTVLLPLAAVLAAAGLAWLLLGPAAAPPAVDEGGALGRTEAGETEGRLREDPVALSGGAAAQAAAARRATEPTWPVVPTDRIPRGTLEVLPVGPDQKPLDPALLTVRLTREGADFWYTPLGIPDADTGVWTFQDLPIGRLTVHLRGDFVVETTGAAEVRTGQVERVEIPTEPAGRIRYEAQLYGGEAPSRIVLRLFTAEKRQPHRAWFQTRVPDKAFGPTNGVEASVGPRGVVYGLAPGRYLLQAESADGELDEVAAEVRALETTDVEIRLRH